MVHLSKQRYATRSYHQLHAKKIGPFPIKKKLGDNAYIVDLPSHYKISNTFNVKDIFEYFPPDDAATDCLSPPTMNTSNSDAAFVVDHSGSSSFVDRGEL